MEEPGELWLPLGGRGGGGGRRGAFGAELGVRGLDEAVGREGGVAGRQMPRAPLPAPLDSTCPALLCGSGWVASPGSHCQTRRAGHVDVAAGTFGVGRALSLMPGHLQAFAG